MPVSTANRVTLGARVDVSSVQQTEAFQKLDDATKQGATQILEAVKESRAEQRTPDITYANPRCAEAGGRVDNRALGRTERAKPYHRRQRRSQVAYGGTERNRWRTLRTRLRCICRGTKSIY